MSRATSKCILINIKKKKKLINKGKSLLAPVAHTCNFSYSGDRKEED
jgi:hypothetical protein